MVTDAKGNLTTYSYSDRDLMTAQVSPVSGTTAYGYNEHGELTSQIDARGVVMSRAVDVLDRATAVTFPTPDLNVTYTYDDPAVPFSKGRLTRIARGTSLLDYRYDRFGRLTQDGELGCVYDGNGNPATVVDPGRVQAVTTFDYANRPSTLVAKRPGKPDQPLVTASSYQPYGPLTSLTLGNGLTEAHGFTPRYFPSTITLGSLLSWTYATDNVGNIQSIADTLHSTNNRTTGRPVAQLDLTGTTEAWKYLTTDHLGTPIAATGTSGAVLWQGGFEPFGADWSGAGGAGVFLRFPGQWEDGTWRSVGVGLSYNLHRWYEPSSGRYSAFDPFTRRASDSGQFVYALSNPTRYIDPRGLYAIDKSCKGCQHPVSMHDARTLADIVKGETDAWCTTRLDAIKDIGLRQCIKRSCRTGKVTCSLGGPVCDGTVEGYSSCGALCRLFVHVGILNPVRTAVLCGNNPVFWDAPGEAGGTVVHEWAHGCGYDPDPGSIPGVPRSGGS